MKKSGQFICYKTGHFYLLPTAFVFMETNDCPKNPDFPDNEELFCIRGRLE